MIFQQQLTFIKNKHRINYIKVFKGKSGPLLKLSFEFLPFTNRYFLQFEYQNLNFKK